MTYEELRGILLDTFSATLIDERANGSLIKFMVFDLFIRKPMGGKEHYDPDELRHNIAGYWFQTEGNLDLGIYDEHKDVFTWKNKAKTDTGADNDSETEIARDTGT